MMKATIIYDNTNHREDLEPDWGFSCLVEAHERTILFDAGGNGRILLENMKKLGIEPSSVTDVFISHSHFDHTGGLSAFLDINSRIRLIAPPSFRGVKNVKEIIYADKPAQLYNNIFTTGELDNIEQVLIVDTSEGLVLITGCSHPDMKNILDAAMQFGKVHGIIGGLHGFSNFELIDNIGFICPTHCTKYIIELEERFQNRYIKGGAGQIIKI